MADDSDWVHVSVIAGSSDEENKKNDDSDSKEENQQSCGGQDFGGGQESCEDSARRLELEEMISEYFHKCLMMGSNRNISIPQAFLSN
tara:strand:- start:602 stop:865 length:264 start_codon:yes stop_codon:yes gene_type:complete